MSLLRRRMMMPKSPQGFSVRFDAADGGLPTDPEYGFVLRNNYYFPLSIENSEGQIITNRSHDYSNAVLYLPEHPYGEKCSITLGEFYMRLDSALCLVDENGVGAKIVFPSRAGTVRFFRTSSSYVDVTLGGDEYVGSVKLEKNGSKFSAWYEGTAIINNEDCYPVGNIRVSMSNNAPLNGLFIYSGFFTTLEYKEF